MGTSGSQAAEIDADTRHAVQAFASKLAGQFAVVGIILFGSRARNNYHPDSDADVAVLLEVIANSFSISQATTFVNAIQQFGLSEPSAQILKPPHRNH